MRLTMPFGAAPLIPTSRMRSVLKEFFKLFFLDQMPERYSVCRQRGQAQVGNSVFDNSVVSRLLGVKR